MLPPKRIARLQYYYDFQKGGGSEINQSLRIKEEESGLTTNRGDAASSG